jgi:DUF971 family protein/molybdopterin converting factor small subunit
MTEHEPIIAPTEINLHKKSRLLEIAFSDGTRFKYPCEYLRVFSPASVGQALDTPVYGKEMVDIASIEPHGTSLLKLAFDDGFTGSYSWNTLHELGVNYDQNWQTYLQKLKDNDLKRGESRAAGSDGKVTIKLLYFIQLARVTGRDEEDVEIPESVTDVETLLAWLRKRRDDWTDAFADDKVQVTVNKHFAEPYTRVEHGDEVAIVPRPE